MMKPEDISAYKTGQLLDLIKKTGYPIVQHNGQRRFGPPPNWEGPPPPRGCEVFIGKLPREIFEDELVPLFSEVGTLYEFRLMMDFSGSNRGYAFATYSTKQEAFQAVKRLNGLEIRPRRHIGVVKSVDNSRLFIGNVPKDKTREDLMKEICKYVSGVVEVVLNRNCYDRTQNRGFAFVEFESHRAAAMARRALVPGCARLWNHVVKVDWAEPEPEVDEEHMKTVKALYVRNLSIRTSPETIKALFEQVIKTNLEKVKKMYDYAFVHFYERWHAELAMEKLQNFVVDGFPMEVKWAKPVDRDLYKIQKRNRGNSKFNKRHATHTLLLYKQHLDKKEYAKFPKEDEGIGSTCEASLTCSPNSTLALSVTRPNTMAPVKLDSICRSYMWSTPIYNYQKYIDPVGNEMCVANVTLRVGPPLTITQRSIGPIASGACFTEEMAQCEAAEFTLEYLQQMRPESSSPILYPTIMSSQPCCAVPCDYVKMYTPPLPIAYPLWRNY